MKFCLHCGSLVPNPNEPCPKCGLTANAFVAGNTNPITQPDEKKESFIPLILSILALISAIIYFAVMKHYSAGTLESVRWLAEHESLVKWNTFFQSSGFSACGILSLSLGAKNFVCCESVGKTIFAYLFSIISLLLYLISAL